jgi:hypothetical protein
MFAARAVETLAATLSAQLGVGFWRRVTRPGKVG